MKYAVEIEQTRHHVTLEGRGRDVRAWVDDRRYDVKILNPEPGVYTVLVGPRVFPLRIAPPSPNGTVTVTVRHQSFDVRLIDRRHRPPAVDHRRQGRVEVTARMPGKIVRILASPHTEIKAGEGILVIEAMKMQNEVRAPTSGRLVEITVREGQTVNAGETLAIIE